MTRYARKVDANQPAIVAAFRAHGCSVIHLHTVGKGCGDILIGFGGICMLVEIKTEKGKETKAQKDLMSEWTGGRTLVRNAEDVARVSSLLKRWHSVITKASLSEGYEYQDLPASHYQRGYMT